MLFITGLVHLTTTLHPIMKMMMDCPFMFMLWGQSVDRAPTLLIFTVC